MIAFVCTNCGFEAKKWVGKCQNCESWNTMVEQEVREVKAGKDRSLLVGIPEVETLFSASMKTDNSPRIKSGIGEFDNAIGGGFVSGSVILIGGEPGIGKSTLLLQLAHFCGRSGKKVVYVSGEESSSQVASRAERMGVARKDGASLDGVFVVSSGSISGVLKAISLMDVDFLFVDSVQTMFVDFIENSPGTINQIRAVAGELISFCKTKNITLILIGHVTKDGAIAGPKLLEHLVDCVMYFEGESRNDFRIIRTTKNRFGATNEIGVFEMCSTGLKEVPNPSAFFTQSAGACKEVLFVAVEGSRCVVVPVESLVAKSYTVSPRRSVVGWDGGRLSMILATIQTHCGSFVFHDKDVYLTMAGGFRTSESANDLAVVASIMLAYKRFSLSQNVVILGEASLKGSARHVPLLEARVKEAKKLGYKNFILPASDVGRAIKSSEEDLNIALVRTLEDIPTALEDFVVKP